MATTLGGTSLSSPDTCMEFEVSAGFSQRRMADNTLITQVSGTLKKGWRLTWLEVSETDKDTIKTEYDKTTALTLSPPDESATYSVHIMRGTWNEPYVPRVNTTVLYSPSFEVEEA